MDYQMLQEVILYALLEAAIDGMNYGPVTLDGIGYRGRGWKQVSYPVGNAYVNWYHQNKYKFAHEV